MFSSVILLARALFLGTYFSTASKLLLTIDTKSPIYVLDPLSPSVAMGVVTIENDWIQYFKDPKLMALSRGLAPAYLRMGGTKADFIHYVPDEVDYQWKSSNLHQYRRPQSTCQNPIRDEVAFENHRLWANDVLERYQKNKQKFGIRSVLKPMNLTGTNWRKLNEFCECVGWKLVYGLNLLTRNGEEWDSSNAELLLNVTENRYRVHWELGNEPNTYFHKTGISLTSQQVGDGFIKLKGLLDRSSWWERSMILGPDANRIGTKPAGQFIDSFLNVGGSVIDRLTFHQYYLNGRTATAEDYLDPNVLNNLVKQLEQMKGLVNGSGRGQPLWLGETASAFGGGAPGLSDRFIDGFMWLDKLGMTSRYGIDMVIRQSFARAHYDLIDDSFNPRPDYWLTYIYKLLVGNRVLAVKITKCSGSQCSVLNNGHVRLYAHCVNVDKSQYAKGAVVLYFINLKKRPIRLKMEPFHNTPLKIDMYLLQPSTPGNLTSTGTLLNGEILRLSNDNVLPPIRPQRLDPSAYRKGIYIPSRTFGFAVFSNANALACLKH